MCLAVVSPALAQSIQVTVSPTAVTLSNSQRQQFTAVVTGAPGQEVVWRLNSTNPADGSLNDAGTYTAPAQITAQRTVTLTASSMYDINAAATATITLVPPSVSVRIAPRDNLSVGAGRTLSFYAAVAGTTNQNVTWSVAGVNNGSVSPAVGPNTVYTAPSNISSPRTATITATSQADPTVSDSVLVSLVPAVSISISAGCQTPVNLSDGQSCQFSANVTGTNTTGVTWSLVPNIGTINGGLYTAPTPVTVTQTVTVTATSVADPSKSASMSLTLVPATPAAVTISPQAVTLGPGQTQQFVATVANAPDQGVTWTISPSGVGSINQFTGLYTAPTNFTSTQTVTVKATSNYDPTKSASAVITLTPSVAVTVKPLVAMVSASQTEQFTATVVGSTNTAVTWSINPPVGDISSTGLYTAPPAISVQTVVTVIATSVADPSKSGTATINLNASSNVGISISPKTVAMTAGQSQVFTATINGTTQTDVTWMAQPFNVGTLTPNGLTATYTAPATITGNQTVTITVTSQSDPNKSATATITLGVPTTPLDVGSGAPSEGMRMQFVAAYYRNGFNIKVSLPPSGYVRKLSGPSGKVGYVQEFPDANKTSGVRYALVKPTDSMALPADESDPILQLTPGVWSYYSSIGAATAGFPTMDAAPCPYFDAVNTCSYALFTNNYAIFAYTTSLSTGQNFYIRNLFYTRWSALGGMSGPGRPVDVETAVTSSVASVPGTMQLYANGVIYNFTSGLLSGKTYGVSGAIFNLYQANGMHLGFLGFPTGDEITLASGLHRQSFQGGSIDWNPGADPSLRWPVAGVSLSAAWGATPVKLNLGDTMQVAAKVLGTNGLELTDRPVSWTTTNSRVVKVTPNGLTATLTAVGGGVAQVTASSEGKTSLALNLQVISRCCEIGEGATPAVQQAFQDAVLRNRLAVVTPAAAPVERKGSGYVQQLQSSEPGSTAAYLLAMPDRQAAAYVVTGQILARYLELGGPAGALGYPIADANAAGRQLFENGALAGTPVTLVAGAILNKWAVLGYEAGPAGGPAGEAASFSTFGANSGEQQAFRGGLLLVATGGPRAGQGYLVSGLILERYLALGGASGAYGMPVSDEFASGASRRQNFEGGYIDYSSGDPAAQPHAAVRQPAVVAAPVDVVAGSRVRLAVLGFPDAATVRVSITGQPDFLASLPNGAYAWETFIPLSAPGATVTVRAVDTATGNAAESSFNVRSFKESQVRLVRVQGDAQTGVPGARLPQPLRVALRDQAGNPVGGAPVVFEASPGGSVAPASAVTDAAGQAETVLRLPPASGAARVTARSVAEVDPVTFTALAAATGLQNFPKLSQAVDAPLGNGSATIAQKGALLTAAAAILRYHQNRGELPAANGLADPAALNAYLKNFCVFDARGSRVCDGFLSNPDSGEQVVNLWRAGEFAGGGVDVAVEKPALESVRDAVAQGSPVLLALAMTADGAAAGGHYLVATGVAENGAILVHDPNPAFGRASMWDYLEGFTAGGRVWKGALVGSVRLLPRAPSATRFLLAAVSQPPALLQSLSLDASSAAGPCGLPLDLPDAATSSGTVSRLVACDGRESVYQLAVGAAQPYRASVTDLAVGGGISDLSGSFPASYSAARPQSILVIGPMQPALAANGVLNAATYTNRIAPGGLISIFGSGLAGPGVSTVVEIGGKEARVLLATPFQINAEAPADLAPGRYTLRVRCGAGQTEQAVEIVAVAPAIFAVGPNRGAVINYQDGTLNTPTTPLRRGQVMLIYATGLGAVTKQGQLSVAAEPVTALLNGQVLQPQYAGLAPGFIGLYQINVSVAATAAPGTDLPLKLRQGQAESNSVPVSIQ